ncbi:hypothetical protein DFJ58DRAFT_630217, partial [Suillus subalutaceus]|uniref:uncharacterized protein n=1 Tax=Suillus subalutaceus TaxID=48586 RepID=UPI001B8701B8
DIFLNEVCTLLAVGHDITVGASTLPRNLKEAGLTRKILRKLASERNESREGEFRVSFRNYFIGDGSEFVGIDETSKNDRTYTWHYGRAPGGHCAQLTNVFVRGDWYSLCTATTAQGHIAAQ